MRIRSRSPRSPAAAGFSLLETLVAISMFLIVLYAVYSVYDVGEANYQKSSRKWDVQSQARVALERMGREVRMTGYASPTKVTDPVVIAAPDTISLHMDVDGTGAKYVTYSLYDCSGNKGNTLYRNVSTSSYCGGQPFIDDVTSLAFTYYAQSNVPITPSTSAGLDGQGYVTGSSVPSPPAAGGQRDSVRQVKVSITVKQAMSGVLIPFTATTDITLRNLIP